MSDAPTPLRFDYLGGPPLQFGVRRFRELPARLVRLGRRVLLITGDGSHRLENRFDKLQIALAAAGIRVSHVSLEGPPTEIWLTETADRYRQEAIDVVCGWGGGSVLDAAKILAGLLAGTNRLDDIRHGHLNARLPLVLVPTTAGPGSEANGVFHCIGESAWRTAPPGVIADLALVDPLLAASQTNSGRHVGALLTLTHLLEAHIALDAHPVSEALAFTGLLQWQNGWSQIVADPTSETGWTSMMLASWLGGLTGGSVVPGVVQRLALPLAARGEMPYAVACATLLAAAVGVQLHVLRNRLDFPELLAAKFAMAGHLLSGTEPADLTAGCEALIQTLNDLVDRAALPRLGEYGIAENDLVALVEASTEDGGPIPLETSDRENIYRLRL